MAQLTFKAAGRRYLLVFFPVMIFYAVFCFAGPALVRTLGTPPLWAISLIAMVNAVPILAVLWLMARYMRETDEYTRRIQSEAMLAGGAVTLAIFVVLGFLGLYDVVPAKLLANLVSMIGPTFFGSWGIAYGIQQRRSR